MKKLILVFTLLAIIISGCTGNSGGNNEENKEASTGDVPAAINTDAGKQTDSTATAPAREYIQPEMKGEITISVMDEFDFLNEGAQMFMAKYPDVKVTVNSFRNVEPIEMEGGGLLSGTPSEEFSTKNYLSLLNTKIMTGKAEDIIMTDPIPFNKYKDMGVFEDLSFFLEHSPEINEESHNMKAFELMKDNNGQLYEIPLTWNPGRIIFFDKQLAEDSKQFLDDEVRSMNYKEAYEYAKKLVDSTNRPNTFLEIGSSAVHAVFNFMNIKDFIDFKNKKVDINNEHFISILHWAKDLEDAGYYDKKQTVDFYNMEYHFALGDDYGEQAAYYVLMPDSTRYHSIPLSDAEGNISAHAFPRFGINSASKKKELSWEFIKFLLSDEFQTSPSLFGLGVNKKGFEASAERTLKMYNDGNKNNIGMQEYVELMNGWLSQVNHYESGDTTIFTEFLYPEVEKFFSGEQSAEDTARILQSKLDKYLNE